jgi:hypothetical protein
VVDFVEDDGLAGQRSAEIDLLVLKAEAAATDDHDRSP